jgi:hypothetical protein
MHSFITEDAFPLVRRMVRDSIELSTFRFSGATEPSRTVAGRHLISNLPALIVARRRPVSLGVCLRWLPDPAGG